VAASAYDEIAEWYDALAGPSISQDDPFFPVVEALIGDPAGQRICDLACGQGRVARYLAGRAAYVVGIDLSAKLLEIARRYEQVEPREIEYLQSDARTLHGISDSAFDGVICFMALMDIEDLAPTFYTVARVLRPGGWFVFATFHPCYHTPRSGEMASTEGWLRTVGCYFTEGHWRSDTRIGPPGKVGAYHHTLSTYLNTLIDAGLTLERVSEPRATANLAEKRPIWAEVPAVFVARCRKRARPKCLTVSEMNEPPKSVTPPREMWDLYNGNGEPLGRTICRGKQLEEGEFHLVVQVWVKNPRGEYLIQKRADNGIWATTAGCVLAGENSRSGAIRELIEELGIHASEHELRQVYHDKSQYALGTAWALERVASDDEICLQADEVTETMWANQDVIRKMVDQGTFYDYGDEYFHHVFEN
jgi:ubiquinone/menaquinone biosynthesis C-methylase UbiE/8-oxo-dGTP pyrophosphatase MutT (NUDIX family)